LSLRSPVQNERKIRVSLDNTGLFRSSRNGTSSGKGLEIPLPKRRDLMDTFRKLIKPVKKP